jgi:anti-anti-sigma factor
MAKYKVLVIDDEKPTLGMFELFLKVYGYDVLLAENGAQGLQIFETEAPDIVFTDIKMPGMDGFEVLDRIKGRCPDTEVIVITGHGDMDLAVEALNHEATDFINKPISRTALDAALQRAVERLNSAKEDTAVAATRQEDDFQVIDIIGNINAASEKELIAIFALGAAEQKNRILLRFQDNTTINGAGIAVLIQLLAECKKQGKKVAITGITENFKQIFDMVGISHLARIFSADHEARASLLQVD